MSAGTNTAGEDEPRRQCNPVACDDCGTKFLTLLQLQGHRGMCPGRADS